MAITIEMLRTGYCRVVVIMSLLANGVLAGEDELIKGTDVRQIKQVMQELQLQELKEVRAGSYAFKNTKGIHVQLSIEETVLVLLAKFDRKASLQKINDWNRRVRFCRAYIDNNNTVVLTTELDLEGGVTEENIANWFSVFDVMCTLFSTTKIE